LSTFLQTVLVQLKSVQILFMGDIPSYMTSPFLSNLFPNLIKEKLYYRYFHTRHSKWLRLFETAPLALCPNVSMYELLPNDVISGNIAFNGFYELALSRRIAQCAKDASLLVDVGANMGYFSLLWTGINQKGTAIAFEPQPRNLKNLENNINRNKLADRIQVIPKAVGDRVGFTQFDVGPVEQTGWGGISTSTSDTNITVPIVRLDLELANSKIDVLKIDVEGADTWVLFGCEELLRKQQIGRIFFEQNLGRMELLGIKTGEAQ
jgi:FkbM family methyltransferase